MQKEDALNRRLTNEHPVLMRAVRSLLLTTTIFALLFWMYVVFRIVINHVGLSDLFIDYVPYFSFWVTGVYSFVISFVSTMLYLILRDPSKGLIHIHYHFNGGRSERSWEKEVREYRQLRLVDQTKKTKIDVPQDQVSALLQRSELLDYAIGSTPPGKMVAAMQLTDRQGRPVIVVLPKGTHVKGVDPRAEGYEVFIVEDANGHREEVERIRGTNQAH